MSQLKLSIATTDYDHFRDFRMGLVKAEGIDHTWLNLGHHECFARFTANREFDLSELSFAKFAAQVVRCDGPGTLTADLSTLPYTRARRPILGADPVDTVEISEMPPVTVRPRRAR